MRATWLLLAATLCFLSSPVRALDRDPWFGTDKALHCGVSVGLAAGSYAALTLVIDPAWQRALLATGFTLGLGAAKELYDATGHGDPSLRDFTWDVIGCALGVAIAYAIDLLLRPRAQSPPPSAASFGRSA
jgi:putative lipoprotein